MPITLCIENVLGNDDTTLLASDVSARNSTIWPTAADVPAYAYKPLHQIWIGTSGNTTKMLSRY